MTNRKITQREAIFYQLYKQRQQNPDKLVPVWQMIGEVYCPDVSKWGFVSYEVSARCSEMFKENPGMLDRQYMRGRTGARYYGYRFHPDVSIDKIKEPDLLNFYKIIKKKNEKKAD